MSCELAKIGASSIVLVLAFIILCVLIVQLISLLDLQNLTQSLNAAENATGYCIPGQPVCTWSQNNALVPSATFSTDFNRNTALVLGDLIGRLENESLNISSPPGFVLLATLSTNTSPVFCALWQCETDLYIIFRGTRTQQEWSKDFEVNQEQVPFSNNSAILVHSGFLSIFLEFDSLIQAVITELAPSHMYIAGHSLGAAVATLAGLQYSDQSIPLVVYAFASPLVGNDAFSTSVASSLVLHRVTNRDDLVPLVPLNVMFNLSGDHQPWLYARAGTDHSFSVNWGSWANNHYLPIYINCLSLNTCLIQEIVQG